jgi:uncharacterized Zn finger protein
MYGIRSSRDANRVYFVTTSSCTCYDFSRGHECKHLLAVRLHCERMRQERQHELAQKHHDIFDRFDDDNAVAREDLARILGKPRRGVIPALRIVREA